MTDRDIPFEYYGWWRILETSQWDNDHIDIIGQALISITGDDDRLRMFVLLAYVNWNYEIEKLNNIERIEFSFEGQDEYDSVSGRGWATIEQETLKGKIIFHAGDKSEFKAKK